MLICTWRARAVLRRRAELEILYWLPLLSSAFEPRRFGIGML